MLPTETDFEAKVSMETEAMPVPEDPPFHILLIGDYSGRENLSGVTEAGLPEPKPIEIDRDNFEDVMKKLNVGLHLEIGDGAGIIPLRFGELDDFHPDRLFQQVPLFSELRKTRRDLLDPDAFNTAAKEVRSWFSDVEEGSAEDSSAEKEAESAEREEPEEKGELLDDILGRKSRDSTSYSAQAVDNTDLGRFIREIVGPHLISTDEAEQAKLVAAVDEITGDLMRKILHHPAFQALESGWRGLYLVVRRTDTSNDLKLFVYDISKPELLSDLKGADDLQDTEMFGELVTARGGKQGGEAWALVCGNYDFTLDVEDTAALMRLAKIANAANAPFISHVRPKMLGIDSFYLNPTPETWNLREDLEEGKLWAALRTFPEASSLGLSTPRFLGRLPYGSETEPTEAFSFEEFAGGIQHDGYLWTNPSFVCALLLAQSYRSAGWEIGRRFHLDLDGLPTHVYQEDGETRTKPCAEITMTHEACDVLIEQGLMPLISFKDTDRVRMGGFQSIAFPSKDLRARWN